MTSQTNTEMTSQTNTEMTSQTNTEMTSQTNTEMTSQTNTEIEIKLKLESLDFRQLLAAATSNYSIKQYYLNHNKILDLLPANIKNEISVLPNITESRIRIKIKDNIEKYICTFKSSGNLIRSEYEYTIDKELSNLLLFNVNNSIISHINKTRYEYTLNDDTFELDVFETIPDLVLVEQEFKSADAIIITNRISEIKEYLQSFGITNITDVTYDSAYKNKNLANTLDSGVIIVPAQYEVDKVIMIKNGIITKFY